MHNSKSFVNLSKNYKFIQNQLINVVNNNANNVILISVSNFHSSNLNKQKVLTIDNINEHILNVSYAVRGPIVARAAQIENELKNGAKKPFDKVIRANIGDCHATGQKPITYFRNIMALSSYPELLKDDKFPQDVKNIVHKILTSCKGYSVGSYTESPGIEIVRKDVAKFIQQRDEGVPCNWEDIYLTSGASDGIKTIMELLLTSKKQPGFMIPIPQYPLYSATISEFNARQVGYYLDEENNWALDITELDRAHSESKLLCDIRALCVINPGNPTGQVLSKENIINIIKWAHKNKLFILSDEVYQDNVYMDGMKFHSFKKVAAQMGPPYSEMEIVSFYSSSKGYMGECGARIGFMECTNLDPDVKLQLDKLISVRLCSSAVGQACMDGIVCPPKVGDESYPQFIKEKNQVLDGLKEKASLVTKLFNSIEGIKCNPVQGAMYAFPKIILPQKAIEKAKSLNMQPDAFYCLQMLEKTGICVVPGSGFLQRPGTFHFRITILPPIEEIKTLLSNFKKFHLNFIKEWSS